MMQAWIRRLCREERGNVLYMTVIVMMLLVMFSLVLTNIIYIGVMKIRAQNAADNIALSAATLKARVANSVVNFNGMNWLVSKTYPQLSGGALALSIGALAVNMGIYFDKVLNKNILRNIAEQNGLNPETSRQITFPVHAPQMSISFMFTYDKGYFAIRPSHPLFVQTRVELETKDYLIGGSMLGFELPDITARARAELMEKNLLGQSFTQSYHVVLVQPNDAIDEMLKRRTSSMDSGQDLRRQISSDQDTSILPGTTDSDDAMDENSIFNESLAKLPESMQYDVLKSQMKDKKITLRNRVRYYQLKKRYGGGLNWFEQIDMQVSYSRLTSEDKESLIN